MDLRPEFLPPRLDETQVQRLAVLADHLDGHGGSVSEHEELVDRFNRDAGTGLAFRDFQGIYGGTDHETWVRSILSLPAARRVPDVTREELVEVVRRITGGGAAEHEITFWLELLKANVPDPNVSDLIFWPNLYFQDESVRELTPEQVVEVALAYRPSPMPSPVSARPAMEPPGS